jgi:hypothetical protein
MSTRATCVYFYILVSLLVFGSVGHAFAQTDTTKADTTQEVKVKKPDLAGHQLCIGADLFHPIINGMLKDRFSTELQADYYLHNEYYLVAEGGWGGSSVNYPDLKYTTNDKFFRFGFNKSVLSRDRPGDWDIMLIGFRGAFSHVSRSSASYAITDSMWGTQTGSVDASGFNAVWVEVTGGMRVELFKGVCAGWNIRGKFLMNGKSFSDLAPIYISGYGKGDKKSIFDYNLYISYAIRWNRKNNTQALKTPEKKTGTEQE